MSNYNGNGRNDAPIEPNGRNGRLTVNLPNVVGGQVVSGQSLLDYTGSEMLDDTHIDEYPATEVLTGDAEQYARVERAIFDLLDAFNVNWDDPNYQETPQRVAKAYMEFWASGYGRDAENEITVFPNSSRSADLVMVKDMRFYSLCSHHLAPFSGFGAIAYLPNKHLLGLSKLGRILDIYARRFQLQERIGAQTADRLMELLQPQGVMVILYDAEHMCMSSRGVKLHEATTTTIAARGVFKNSAQLRSEVMALLR